MLKLIFAMFHVEHCIFLQKSGKNALKRIVIMKIKQNMKDIKHKTVEKEKV